MIINSFGDLHQFLQSYSGFAYRGVSHVEYELVPAIGREWQAKKVDPIGLKVLENAMLRKFKQQAIPRLETIPRSDWEWWFLAQHHGLPTRLLDWTTNPLVAAYFACRKEHEGDAAIYAIRPLPPLSYVDLERDLNPLCIDAVRYLWPIHVTPRLPVQSGLFTVHPDPQQPWSPEFVDKIVIGGPAKKQIRRGLATYGIHEASLFPDLDGLARHFLTEIRLLNDQFTSLDQTIKNIMKTSAMEDTGDGGV